MILSMQICRKHRLAPTAAPSLREFVPVLVRKILIGNKKRNRHLADSLLVDLVETKGIEPSTSRMRTERSPS